MRKFRCFALCLEKRKWEPRAFHRSLMPGKTTQIPRRRADPVTALFIQAFVLQGFGGRRAVAHAQRISFRRSKAQLLFIRFFSCSAT